MESISMNPNLTHQARLRAAGLRHRGSSQQIGETFARLGPIAEAVGLFDGRPQLIAFYHDDPASVPAADLRSDAGVLIAEGTPVPDGLTEVVLAAGPCVHTRHVGPYATLPATWARLKASLSGGNGPRRGNGPGYEAYRNNPMTAAPENLLTDVFIPTA
jgi:AraC family transcriptional regulator